VAHPAVLVAVNNVEEMFHHIHVLIRVTTHSKDTPEHLQEPRVGDGGGGGGTIAAGSVSRSHNWRRSATTSWILQNSRVK
jgi:hypothetical protein